MNCKIELAKKTDARDIFNLSNDNAVRRNSFNTSQIPWNDHIIWFNNKIQSQDCIYYVIRDDAGQFIGQVRFDKSESEKEHDGWVISISLCKEYRGKGLGTMLLKNSTQKAIEFCEIKKIYAYIKEINQASLKSFFNAGYGIACEEIVDGVKSFKLVYKCQNC